MLGERVTESEEYLLYSFEKLFLFEFYVRNLRLNQSREFENLLQLKVDIEEKFVDLPGFEEEGIFIKDLVTFVLDFLQFDYEISQLPTLLAECGISDELVTVIVDVCTKFENTPKIDIANSFYRFVDLVYSNDILEVMRWWGNILDKDIRRENNLEGTFGYIGKSMIGDSMTKEELQSIGFEKDDNMFNVFSFDFNCPSVMTYKRDNYCIFSSNYDDVKINNETQLNSLVLSIDIDKSADNIDSILEEFKSTFCILQSQRNWDLINSEIDPTTKVPVSFPYESILEVPKHKSYTDIIKDERKYKTFITKYTSINKWLIALYCYDLCLERNDSFQETAKAVIAKIKEFKLDQPTNSKTAVDYTNDYDIDTIKQYYSNAKSNIKNAPALLEKYLSKA